MRKIVFSQIFILLFIFSGYSMSFFTNSRQSLGIREYVTSIRGLGMGGTGLALPDGKSLNAYNIATWRHIRNTTITISMHYNYTITDYGWESIASSTANFNGVQLAIPIQRKKWVFGLSLTPYTWANYKYTTDVSQPAGDYQETIFYDGNLSRARLNLVWAPVPRLGVGISFNYYFGTFWDRYKIAFNDPAFYDSPHEVEYEFHGPGAGISFDLQMFDSLFIGGFLDLNPSLDFYKILHSPITSTTTRISSQSTLPLQWGIGSSYSFKDNWTITSDLSYQYFSKGFDIEQMDLTQLENWYRFGFGIEHSHFRKRKKSLLQSIDIRSGISLGNIGYKFNGNSVREYTLHLGVGIPFFYDRSRLDIALQAGIRGDKEKTIARETFYRITFSISSGELWFQKIR